MAGHSHFANIKHKKDNVDKKKSKIFTKLVRDIIIAVKVGKDANPELNPKLKFAISMAKNHNLPKDKIENAIRVALAKNTNTEDWEQVKYNGTFTGGIACIIEAVTDNKNRTIAEIRSIFTDNNGKIVDSGSIEFMFKRIGLFVFDKLKTNKSFDEFFEYCINNDIDNILHDDDYFKVECQMENFDKIYNIFSTNDDFSSALIRSEISWVANEYLKIEDEKRDFLQNINNQLEDLNDVEYVHWNVDLR